MVSAVRLFSIPAVATPPRRLPPSIRLSICPRQQNDLFAWNPLKLAVHCDGQFSVFLIFKFHHRSEDLPKPFRSPPQFISEFSRSKLIHTRTHSYGSVFLNSDWNLWNNRTDVEREERMIRTQVIAADLSAEVDSVSLLRPNSVGCPNVPTLQTAAVDRTSSAFEILLLIAVLLCSLFTVARTVARIQLPYQMDYAEGTILNSSLRFEQTGSLYQPIGNLPQQIDPYPPIIYKLVSLTLVHGIPDFLHPRLLALAAPIVACCFAALLILHWTKRWTIACAFGFMPLTVTIVQAWIGVVRFDYIGIALSLAGLTIFVSLPRYRFLSLPLFLVAVGGLYTLLAAPAACCLYLWADRKRTRSLLFAACLGAMLIACFECGQYLTHGWMGFHLFKTQGGSPYSLSQLASFAQVLVRGYALLLVMSALLLWRGIRDKPLRLPALYLLLTAATTLSLGKIGAVQNHILQFVFVACIAAALGYHSMQRAPANRLGAILVLSTLSLITLANIPFRPKKPIEDLAGCDAAYRAVRFDLGSRILSDNVGALVLAGKRVYISDPFVYRWMVSSGAVADNDLRQFIRAREFSSILLNHRVEGPVTNDDRWPDDVRVAIRDNYQFKGEFNCNDAHYYYVPNGPVAEDKR